jgi:hypothetical protein
MSAILVTLAIAVATWPRSRSLVAAIEARHAGGIPERRLTARDAVLPLAGAGTPWPHGYGDRPEKRPGSGEAVDVEPGGRLREDPSVRVTTGARRLRTGLLGGARPATDRLAGPGRVGPGSVNVHLPTGT